MNELRRTAAEIDEAQRIAMARATAEPVAPEVPPSGRSRRDFLRGLGLGGAAVTVGASALVAGAGVAGAQTTTAGSTTTTAPPRTPTNGDLVLLGYLQSVELAAVKVYDAAVASKQLTGDTLALVLAFQQHHNEHAQAMSGQGGKAATGIPNQSVIDDYTQRLAAAKNGDAVLEVLFQLETALASSYVQTLGDVQSTRGAQVLASVGPIESRHCVVVGQLLNKDMPSYVPTFENVTYAITPANAPIRK